MYRKLFNSKINIVCSNEATRKFMQGNSAKSSCKPKPVSSLISLENAGYINSSTELLDNKSKKLVLPGVFDIDLLRIINDMDAIKEAHNKSSYSVRRLSKDPFLFEPSIRYYNYLNYVLRYPERGFLEYNLIMPEITRNIYYINREEIVEDIY